MQIPCLLIFLSAAAATVEVEPLKVKADPGDPGRVIVATNPGAAGDPVVVVHAPGGRASAYFRSPDPRGFVVCEFLRHAGLSRTPGPIDVTVWRGDLSAPLRLEYDGRSCVAEPTLPGGERSPRFAPLVIPTSAPPAATAPKAGTDQDLASARVERIVLSADGKGHRFLVRLDRNVQLPSPAQVVMKRLFRLDLQKEVPGAAARLPVRAVDHGLDWRTQPGLLRFDPPLRKGEKLRLTFEIGSRLFDHQNVTFDPS